MNEFLLRLLIGQLQMEIHVFLFAEHVVGLGLFLLDEVLVVLLAVLLGLLVLLPQLQGKLLVLVDLLLVLLLDLFDVGDDGLLRNEVVAIRPHLLHLLKHIVVY